MIRNREVFVRDPMPRTLANDGVARVSAVIDPAVATEELEMFVCSGQYEAGLTMLLQTYVNNLGKPVQPAGWVSGFFGSGKSHLVKVLRYLWTNEVIAGKRAREISHLPPSVTDLLRELDVRAKQVGGIFACSGVLDVATAAALPGKVAGIVLTHLGLPADPATARFAMRLREDKLEEKLKAHLGADYNRELEDFRCSDKIGEFLAKHKPALGDSAQAVLDKLNNNYPVEAQIDTDGMVRVINEALSKRFGCFPCSLLVLDEAQQFVGTDATRGTMLQHVAEALTGRFEGRLMLVATGQSALNTTELLRKLQDRFTKQIQLQDKDIDTVIRNVVLAKKPDKLPAIQTCVFSAEGEITRQLKNSRLETVAEDKDRYVEDYPVLPVRRRFWERFLRSVETGLTGQLRTQLRLTLDSVKKIGDRPVGNVVPADAMFDQLATVLVENGVLDRQQSNDIQKLLTSGSEDDRLKGRLCALIFMIHKLPRDQSMDLGVRATAESLADLLVEDIGAGGHALRERVPVLLAELEKDGVVMRVGDEYRQQTTEFSQWEQTFQKHLRSIRNSATELPNRISETLTTEVEAICDSIKIAQGTSKVRRPLTVSFSESAPPIGDGITVWARTGWGTAEKSFHNAIEARGPSDPLVAIFIPNHADEAFREQLAIEMAAARTLAERSTGASAPAAIEARSVMESKQQYAKGRCRSLLDNDILPNAKVFLSGSGNVEGLNPEARIRAAAEASLARMYPRFSMGDSDQWEAVFKKAKAGEGTPLGLLGYQGSPEEHPVCRLIHQEVGAGKKGSELRKKFTSAPYGWPQATVDGAIMVLLGCELLKAYKNHTQVSRTTIEQSTVGAHDFKTDAPPVTVQQKMAIRSVCSTAGLVGVNNEELDLKTQEALRKLVDMAADAGGDAPLPPPPPVNHIKAILGTAGNAMLAEVAGQADVLKKNADDFRRLGQLKKARLAQWQTLTELLTAAKDAGLAVHQEVAPQAEAILAQRSLLADPDPVPRYIRTLSDAIRAELTARHAAAAAMHDEQSALLAQTPEWKRLGETDRPVRDNLAESHQLKPIAPISIATEAELLGELRRFPISRWKELQQALPTRFQNARADAARALQPKAVSVSLRKGTIASPAELEAWLEDTRARITKVLQDGNPVIV